ncbi:MAG TPA: 50S ribosomal protein L11 methyltransferase [Candidatus Omnitrophota bacterium]|nr:50S ribosomal protein L11 methyltransferase [Candidatus Omnitrophota bacterium]HPS36776.1 50S ribosomal protein L11 methyltransferase [Candidatus Omnitrophota bacterium]
MTLRVSSSDQYSCIELALSGKGLGSPEKRAARELFDHCKVPAAERVCTDYKGLFRLSYYTRSSAQAARIVRCFRERRIRRVRFTAKILGRHDWFDKWKIDYHIRPLGSKFMIVPVWERKKYKSSGRLPIFLEPGSAFGSGYHETTRLMVRLMESLGPKMRSFLDIGTGTGILAVAASKLGAEKVDAFDNDKPSVIAARKNFKMNGCSNGKFFGANLKRLGSREKFETVGANLLSKTLLECRRPIVARVRVGGHLLVSGIALQNLPGFRRGFHSPALKCLRILRGRKWAALLYRKIES